MLPNTMYAPQKDSPSTSLLTNILSTDTIIYVVNAGVLPASLPFPLTLGIDKSVTERVIVTGVDLGTNRLTVSRSTSALAWEAGTLCARVFNSADLTSLQGNINTLDNNKPDRSEVTTLQTEITDLRVDVTALQQQGGKFIGISFPTYADLIAYTIPSTVNVGDFTYVLDDETHSDATTRYIYDGTQFDFAYVINYDPIVGILFNDTSSASEEAAIIASSADPTKVYWVIE